MAYSEEYKTNILKRMEEEKIAIIAEDTGISKATLYNWRKEYSKKKIIIRQRGELKEETKRYQTNEKLESKMIIVYIKRGRKEDIEKAEEIGKRFRDDEMIQSQMVTIYMKRGNKEDLEKAEEIGKRFLNNEVIQSQMVTLYMKRGNKKDLEKAEEIGKKFYNYGPIQSQMVTIYMKRGNKEDLEKAEEIGKRFPNNEVIQSQMVTLYMERGRKEDIEKAEEIGRKFYNYGPIQSQMVTLYMERGRKEDIEKAEEIGRRFPNNEVIQNQMAKIHNNPINELKTELISVTVSSDMMQKLNILGLKIRTNTLSIKDLEDFKANIEMDSYSYNIVLIAMYEKLNQKKNALEIIKKMKEDKLYTKDLNPIFEGLKSKKKRVYPFEYYTQLIGWQLKEEEIQNAMKQTIAIENKSNEGIKKGEKEEEKSIAKSKGTKIPKGNFITYTGQKVQSKGVKPNNIVKEDSSVPRTIREELSPNVSECIKEINIRYYIKMQSQTREQAKYIKKYDKLESILAKKFDNKRAEIELMLVLINEGYREVVQKEFPEDYHYINEVIKNYYSHKLTPKEAIKQLDGYASTR